MNPGPPAWAAQGQATPFSVMAVSGPRSGVGKTLWIESLTRSLAQQGFRVAVVKHHGHIGSEGRGGVEQPVRGSPGDSKDTERARRAGAVERVLVSATSVVWEGTGPGPDAPTAFRTALSVLGLAERPVDVVLAEGFRQVEGIPRLWVAGMADGEGPRGTGESTLVVHGEDAARREAVARVLAWMRGRGIPAGPPRGR